MNENNKNKKVNEKPVKAKVKEPKVKKEKGVSFFKSISFKVIVVVIVAVVVSNIVTLAAFFTKSKEEVIKLSNNCILNVVETTAANLNMEYDKIYDLSEQTSARVLANVKVDGMDTSFCYLVTLEGVYKYHADRGLIGTNADNTLVKDLLSQISKGKTVTHGSATYEEDGVEYCASYEVLKDKSVFVIAAEQAEIMKEISGLLKFVVLAVVAITGVFAVLAYVVSMLLVNPIKKITKIIEQTASFDYRRNPDTDKLVKRGDESGAMARSVGKMRAALREIVADIDSVNKQIIGNVDELKYISSNINSMCTDNSATTEELSAGVQETSATTETISNNIGQMQNAAGDIKALSQNGEKMSYEIRERATALKDTTESASERTTAMYRDVKQKTEMAIENSKAVNKINELTAAIMAISSQTSLLALNASIEAARAGEAGRGFAVVATEIGNLANETSQTVGNINDIVKEVNFAVDQMTKSMEDAVDFLEKVVIQDYAQFSKVSEQYNADAGTIQTSMKDIEDAISKLADTISEIAEALNGINATVNEAAIGISDVAGKTSDVVSQTVQNNELVDDCLTTVSKLTDIVGMFKLDK